MSECSKCGIFVHVPEGHEFLEGDMCCCCIADENERLQGALTKIIAILNEVPTIGYKRGQWWSARCESIELARHALLSPPPDTTT